MEETFSDSVFIDVELTTVPCPPGAKGTPRPVDRPREVFLDDPPAPPATLPTEQRPEKSSDS